MVMVAAVGFIPYIKNIIWPAIYQKIWETIYAPAFFPDMMWIALPLLITMLFMEFYFDVYTQEEMGWNSAVGNALVLVFVSIDLMRQIYGNIGAEILNFQNMQIETFIAALIFVGGLWLLFVDFFHILPKRLAFFVSAALPVNLAAYLAIVSIYSDILLPKSLFTYATTFMAYLIIFIIMIAIFTIIHQALVRIKALILKLQIKHVMSKQ
jgi:hypothetical protein